MQREPQQRGAQNGRTNQLQRENRAHRFGLGELGIAYIAKGSFWHRHANVDIGGDYGQAEIPFGLS